MIWLYERGDDIIRITTRRETASGEYLVEIDWADGRHEVERYADVDTFDARLQALERHLTSDRWTQVGPPHLIAGDWRGLTH